MPMKNLLVLSGTELAAMIRNKQISSAEVVEAHIRRIEHVNPSLNAVVYPRYEEARAEAKEADRRLASEDPDSLGPFFGVPCTIKESFALSGMPNSGGLFARRHLRSPADAITVARLRSAGAIPMGVTNISELCMWMESHNKVYGRTKNAYDSGRIAGGSSGGEGSIVGAGGAPFGLGSDIGGSIRMPAFFNGVFGHKPTGGLIDNEGQFPIAHGEALRYMSPGPLARRAEDLMPLLRVLAGPEARQRLSSPGSVDIAELQVMSIEDNGRIAVSDELRAAQDQARKALETRGAHTKSARHPALRRSLEIWSSMLHAAGGPSFSEMLGDGAPIQAGRELVRFAIGRSPYTFPALGLAILERLPDLLGAERNRFIELGMMLKAELIDLLGPRGVFLYPSYSDVAPKHKKPLLPPFNWVYTAIWNVLEFPVTQVPLGLGKEGLPIGVQVVGAPGNDHITIAVALALEQSFGGWVPPFRA